MSALNPKKTYKNLKKKGFVDSENRSDDHKYLELFYNNKLVLYTKISHGNQDLGNHLIKQMAVQFHLDKDEIMNLSNCPLSKEDYFEILEKKALLA